MGHPQADDTRSQHLVTSPEAPAFSGRSAFGQAIPRTCSEDHQQLSIDLRCHEAASYSTIDTTCGADPHDTPRDGSPTHPYSPRQTQPKAGSPQSRQSPELPNAKFLLSVSSHDDALDSSYASPSSLSETDSCAADSESENATVRPEQRIESIDGSSPGPKCSRLRDGRPIPAVDENEVELGALVSQCRFPCGA